MQGLRHSIGSAVSLPSPRYRGDAVCLVNERLLPESVLYIVDHYKASEALDSILRMIDGVCWSDGQGVVEVWTWRRMSNLPCCN